MSSAESEELVKGGLPGQACIATTSLSASWFGVGPVNPDHPGLLRRGCVSPPKPSSNSEAPVISPWPCKLAARLLTQLHHAPAVLPCSRLPCWLPRSCPSPLGPPGPSPRLSSRQLMACSMLRSWSARGRSPSREPSSGRSHSAQHCHAFQLCTATGPLTPPHPTHALLPPRPPLPPHPPSPPPTPLHYRAHYSGRLASNDLVFDSSYERGRPLSFRVGGGVYSGGEVPSQSGHGVQRSWCTAHTCMHLFMHSPCMHAPLHAFNMHACDICCCRGGPITARHVLSPHAINHGQACPLTPCYQSRPGMSSHPMLSITARHVLSPHAVNLFSFCVCGCGPAWWPGGGRRGDQGLG